MSDYKPLKGVKVVEVSQMLAASACGRMLADLGAEVIKVESTKSPDTLRVWPKGQNTPAEDDFNPVFDNLNANKRGVSIDGGTEKGREAIYRLLENADAFVSNLRTKALKKQGLDWETLHEKFPKLVMVQLDGYGQKGAEASRPGYDNTAMWARGGFLYGQAVYGDYPVFIPMGFGDVATGMALFAGTVSAIIGARTTGKGDHINISLYGLSCWLSNIAITGSQFGIKFPKHREAGTPFGSPYKCKDDHWFLPLIANFRDFKKYFETLGADEYANSEEYLVRANYNNVEFSEPVLHRLEELYAQKTAKEWNDAFVKADLACEILYTYEEVREDEQARVNGFTFEHDYGNGRTAVLERTPIQSERMGMSEFNPAPQWGEDTKTVLAEVGYSDNEIDEMIAEGVAKQHD